MYRKNRAVICCILINLIHFCLGSRTSLAQKNLEPPSVASRVTERSYPSVFQAWNPADNLPTESAEDAESRHDLMFHDAGFFWLHWNNQAIGLADGFTKESIRNARQRRERLLNKNPKMVLLCEIRYRDAHKSYLPDDHPWWLRNETGHRVVGWEEGGYYLLDYHNPDFRAQVVKQAVAATRTGVVNGIMLDWWTEDDSRIDLVREMRQAIGEDALILVNANDRKTPRSASYINGIFMECYRSRTPEEWQTITSTLVWAEENLRKPRINCLETWFDGSRKDLRKMRATTTLALTHSDGYVLFSDPNELPTSDHLHDWYPFWEKSLGKPLSNSTRKVAKATLREFQHGVAIFNPHGSNPVTIELDVDHRSLTTHKVAKRHSIASGDGDILIRSR